MAGGSGTAYYVPPVVQAGKYNEKCDVWSIGVILYILLTAVPPFAGKDDAEIMRRAKQGKIDYDIRELRSFSKQVKDLIRNLCQIDIQKRFSAQQALEDQWVGKQGKYPLPARERAS